MRGSTNQRIWRTVLVLMSALAAVTTAAGRVVEVADERLEFTPAPERGYVVKAALSRGGVNILAASLFMEDGDVRPVRGLGQHGILVVERPLPAGYGTLGIESFWATGGAKYLAPLFSSNGETVAVIPEIVVRVIARTDIEQVRDICESLDLAIIKPMEFTEVEYLLDVLGPDADAVFSAVEELNKISFVGWACPNTGSRFRLAGQAVSAGDRVRAKHFGESAAGGSGASGVFPNDEYFPMQWHLHNTGRSGGTLDADINAPEAWEITTGDPNIIIAVLDTGVDTNHPDLVNNPVQGYDFYDNDDQPDESLEVSLDDPTYGYGTGCAGLVAAMGDNALGVTGVTWGCKIMPIRIESADGLCSDADIATAFRWMADNGAGVITNSWGYGAAVPITHSAIIDVTKPDGLGRGGKGCVVLDASGNSGLGRVRYIGRYPEVIAVGATDHDDLRWYYSNYGLELDIVAPSGGLVESDIPGGFQFSTDISGPYGVNVPFGEWEKIPRLQAKTLVRFWHGALSQIQPYNVRSEVSSCMDYEISPTSSTRSVGHSGADIYGPEGTSRPVQGM